MLLSTRSTSVATLCVAMAVSAAILSSGCTPDSGRTSSRSAETRTEPTTASVAATATSTSATDSASSRGRVLSAVQETLQKRLGQPLKFDNTEVAITGDYAYVIVYPTKPDGGAIDYRAFPEFREAIELGQFDDGSEAVLHRIGGEWSVLEYRIGPTDTKIEAWGQRYGVTFRPE